jgi:methionyl aminopeptidase
VGRDLHEEPPVPNFGKKGTGPELKRGMVFAVEPMVNAGGYDVKTKDDKWTIVTADGRLSAHFEHTVAVTGEGYEILTLAEEPAAAAAVGGAHGST